MLNLFDNNFKKKSLVYLCCLNIKNTQAFRVKESPYVNLSSFYSP